MTIRYGKNGLEFFNAATQTACCIISDLYQAGEKGKAYLNSLSLPGNDTIVLVLSNNALGVACILGARILELKCILIFSSRQKAIQDVIKQVGTVTVVHVNTGVVTTKHNCNIEPMWKSQCQNGMVGLLTSGSMCDPKIVALTWKAMEKQGITTGIEFGENCAFVCTSPISHAYAINFIFAAYYSTKECHLVLAASGDAIVSYIGEKRKSKVLLFGTPGIYVQLQSCVVDKVYVDEVYCAGTKVELNLKQEMETKLGVPLRQNYGCTECGSIAAQYGEQKIIENTVGLPWKDVEVHVDHENKLSVRTPWQGLGYLREGQLIAFNSMHTIGDYGSKIDNCIVVHNRVRPLIERRNNQGSVFWSPNDIVQSFEKHPDVAKCMIPMYHKMDVDTVLNIYIILKENTSFSNVQVDEFQPYKITVREYFACSPAGKIILHQ